MLWAAFDGVFEKLFFTKKRKKLLKNVLILINSSVNISYLVIEYNCLSKSYLYICLSKIIIESGVSENAVSGHIQVLLPGKTACFAVGILSFIVLTVFSKE